MGSDVVFVAIRRLEPPLDKNVSLIASRGPLEQHLETVAGCQCRDAPEFKFFYALVNANAAAHLQRTVHHSFQQDMRHRGESAATAC
jgi:hypothetical protein